MKGDRVPHSERCRAMASHSGRRCPNRHTDGVVCVRHKRAGAIIPDDWTQPDNLPVFTLPLTRR